jgi:hypothetical protein
MNRAVTVTLKGVLLIVLFVMPLKLFSKEFQRYRIPAGSYLIRNEGMALTATCLDGPARPAPHSGDYIFAASPAISVTRTMGGQHSTVSFNDAIKQDWIKVEGLGQATSVQISPVTPDPQIEYRLTVAGGGKGVIGGGTQDVDSMLVSLPSEPLPELDALDKLTTRLESVFDQGSIVTDAIRQRKYDLESRLAHPKKGPVTKRDIVDLTKSIREIVFPDDASAQEVLARCTILKNALLTEQDITVLEGIAPKRTGQYDPDLLAAAKRFLGRPQALYQTLGPGNVVSNRYDEGLSELQYNLVTEKGSPVSSVNFDKATNFLNEFVLSKRHWTDLALYNGELLEEKVLKALEDFGPAQTEIYDPGFLAAWKDFRTSQSLLSDTFGAESQLTQQFQQSVRSDFHGDLSATLEKVRSTIFPESVQSLNSKPGNADYISLLLGQEINASKADALKRALGWEVQLGSGRLDSFVYLYMDDEDELVLNTTTSSGQADNGSLKKVLQDHPNVVLEDGLVDSDMAAVLRGNGVKFARTFSHLVQSNIPSRPKVKLVFVISSEPSRLAKMFPGQPETAVVRALALAKEAESKGLGVIVDNKKALIESLDSLKADERALICYHGSDHIVFWDSNLPVEYLSAHEYGNRCELLSCDTWRTSDWGMMSLDRIDLETTFNAAIKTAESHAIKLSAGKSQTRDLNGSPPNGPPPNGPPPPPPGGGSSGGPPPTDFGGGFTANYVDLESKDKKKQYLVVGIIVAGGVIAYYIVTTDTDTAKDGG